MKKKAQVPGKFRETNKQKNILKWPLTTLLCNLVTIIVILKHALYLKKYAWHCLTQNICSSVSPIKKIYFEICSKTTRWVVEKMSECNIQQYSGGPSEGPGLGPACSLGKAKPPEVVELWNLWVGTVPWCQRSYFQVFPGISTSRCTHQGGARHLPQALST